MNDRERLINELYNILLESDCLNDMTKSKVVLVLDKYEVQARTTELAMVDEFSNRRVIEQFATAKAVSGRSPRTIKQYVLALERFVRIMKVQLIETTAEDMRNYTAHRIMKDKVYGIGLVNERSYLSSFFDWAVKSELMVRNPAKQIEGITLAKVPRKPFSEMECEKIRTACKDEREKAMVEMLFSTACRAAELSGILISNITGNEISICGKGKKYASVYLDSKARLALDRYLAVRKSDSPFLFPGRKPGTSLSVRTLEAILRKIGVRAGVSNVYAHRFRHTAATMARNRGMQIEMIMEFLRHENIQTTLGYLDLTKEELMYQHRKYVA